MYQFVVDHLMNQCAIRRFWDQYFQPMPFQPLRVETLLHRERRTEQADAAMSGCRYRVASGITNVK